MIKLLLKKLISLFILLGIAKKVGSEKEYNTQFRRHIDLINYMNRIGISKDTKILDIGCGMGFLAEALKFNGFPKVYGIDWLPEDKIEKRQFLDGYLQIDFNHETNMSEKINSSY